MFNIGKDKKQEVVIITAKGVAQHEVLEADSLCFTSPNTLEAWELDYNQQAKNEETGQFTQFVSSLNKQPLKIYENREQSESHATKVIAAQKFDEKLTQIQKDSESKSMLLWMGIITVVLAIIIGLIVLANMGQ